MSSARGRSTGPIWDLRLRDMSLKSVVVSKTKGPISSAKKTLQPITTTCPLELVFIDFLHLERCKGGYEYILAVMGHYTCFAQVYATRNKSAKTAADKLFNDFVLRFGMPSRLYHDRGREFENRSLSELQKLCGIHHSRTIPYHPQGNGQVERFNRFFFYKC